jgi:hypothetical protein
MIAGNEPVHLGWVSEPPAFAEFRDRSWEYPPSASNVVNLLNIFTQCGFVMYAKSN